MQCLVVKAHPLAESLCSSLTRTVLETLEHGGHTVVLEDLYAEGFDPALSRAERASYYDGPYAVGAVQNQVERLLAAEAIVLVFPTWWFGFPAILKGWFDRVWAPGVAYDHADGFGPIKPRLTHLRRLLVVTTLGSPGWVDRLILRQPVKRILKRAIIGTCAPGCRVEMVSFYRSEKPDPLQVARFSKKVVRRLERWNG